MFMKRIYMAGCGGMLGEAFYQEFKKEYELKCTDIDLNSPWLSYCDFRDYEMYKNDVIKFNPDYLFHLGAHTDLEYCEKNIEDTYLTNTKSVEYAVKIANELNIPILYISTAGIFDGKKEVYAEDDLPNPIGQYARSKYLGEQHVLNNARKFLICRAGWMMGGGPKKDKKFIQKIMQQILSGNKKLYIVNDKLGTPTYTHDFANNVKLLIKKNIEGLFNMVCEGKTSRMEVTQELLTIIGLNKHIQIIPVPSSFFKDQFFAIRPDSECLVNKRLNKLGLNKMNDWKTSLKIYIEKYYKEYVQHLYK